MKIKTSELTRAALAWAVAKYEYDNKRYKHGEPCFNANTKRVYETEGLQQIGVNFAPSTNWAQGGRIIEREGIELAMHADQWRAVWHGEDGSIYQDGPTPLIAAMRCYVASKLGDEVDVPEELL